MRIQQQIKILANKKVKEEEEVIRFPIFKDNSIHLHLLYQIKIRWKTIKEQLFNNIAIVLI